MFFVLFANLLHMQYEENDDILMCLIANGNFSGVPDYHLVFQNSIWGYFVSSLYRMLPSIEWYTVLFSIIHIGAMSIISYFLIRRHRDNLAFLGCTLICIYAIWMVCIQSFQFTTTAGILSIAGCLLFFGANMDKWGVGYVCILISSLIRLEAAGFVVLLFLPLFILTYSKQWKKYLHLLCLSLLVLIPIGLERTVFYSNEWKEYYEYNRIRGSINDNPNINKIKEKEIQQIGISKQDYAMLCGFNPDPKVITLPVLKQIHQCLANIPIGSKIENLGQLVKYRIPIILLLLITMLMLIILPSNMTKMIIILWFIWMFSLLGGLCLDHQLKNRVFICALLAIVTFYIMIPTNINERCLAHFMICACLLGLSGKYIYQSYKVSKAHEVKYIQWHDYQLPLLKELPGDAVVAAMSPLVVEGMSPYHIKDFHCKLYPLGWVTNIPFNEMLGHSHADLTSKNVYLLGAKETDISRLAQYIEQKYNIKTLPVTAAYNEKYAIVQLR